jgi:hypothetical protein
LAGLAAFLAVAFLAGFLAVLDLAAAAAIWCSFLVAG